jgi:hypothetical protein
MRPQDRRFWREGVRWWWYDYEWPVVGLLALAVVWLGGVGFHLHFEREGQATDLADLIFKSVQLFVLETNVDPPMPWQLNVARFLAPVVAAYTAVQALGKLFAGQLSSLRLRLRRGHIVIGGLGRKGWALARGFLQRGHRVVVIEQNAENDLVNQCREMGGVVMIGDAAEPWVLRKAGVGRARFLFALCGDDGVNAEIAVRAAELMPERSRPALTCVLHIFDPELCTLLRERELEAGFRGRLRLDFFNIYDLGARVLLEENPIMQPGPDPAARDPHLVIVGVGRLGQSLLIHAARQWHTEGAVARGRLRVTLVDPNAVEIVRGLLVNHPALGATCDLEPRSLNLQGGGLRGADDLRSGARGFSPSRVFVCLENESLGLSAALELARLVPDGPTSIVVCMMEEAGLAVLLRGQETSAGSYRCLRAFGLLDRTCHPGQILRGAHEVLAHALHEEYLRAQRVAGVTVERNASMVPWDSLAEHLQESNRQQADVIGAKLKAVGCCVAPLSDWSEPLFEFTTGEIERLARLEHDRWMNGRVRDGWRYGARRDDAAKTHPCLVPYEELPADERDKNCHAVRQLPDLLARVGFRVLRLRSPLSQGHHGSMA